MSERVKARVRAMEAKKEQTASRRRPSERSFSSASPFEHVISLQRIIGNRGVQRLIKSSHIQPKLKIGPQVVSSSPEGRHPAYLAASKPTNVRAQPGLLDPRQFGRR